VADSWDEFRSEMIVFWWAWRFAWLWRHSRAALEKSRNGEQFDLSCVSGDVEWMRETKAIENHLNPLKPASLLWKLGRHARRRLLETPRPPPFLSPFLSFLYFTRRANFARHAEEKTLRLLASAMTGKGFPIRFFTPISGQQMQRDHSPSYCSSVLPQNLLVSVGGK